MLGKWLVLAAVAIAGPALDAAATMAPIQVAEARVERIEYGTVDSVTLLYRAEGESTPGPGAVLGGIAGGVLGHQVGRGRGKDLATVAGALGGAYAGNQIERNRQRDRYRITVNLDSGARLEIEDEGDTGLRVGDRVRVVNGRVSRE